MSRPRALPDPTASLHLASRGIAIFTALYCSMNWYALKRARESVEKDEKAGKEKAGKEKEKAADE